MSFDGGQTFTVQTNLAPWQARDGPAGASYYSNLLGVDILYLATGYIYKNAADQAADNGYGANDVN